MGASDSKLVFKKGIFRLSEERNIPADDPYWTCFWELPESVEDVFSLFSPTDIRRTRDNALENLETLILALCSRLIVLRHHPSFPEPDLAPERHALNCIRVLTRILPYLHENETLHDWEDNFFWASRRKRTRKSALSNEVLFDESLMSPRLTEEDFEDAKPLGEELLDIMVDLLFFSDLTVPKQPKGSPKVSYSIWQSGVGCNTTIPTTREYENNRSEVLRLLLTMTSEGMYMSPTALPAKGIKALTHLCACGDKQTVLSVLCSLLNTTLKYNPATWRVPYNALVSKDTKQILVTYTLQLLLVMIIYPIPEQITGLTSKNYYRHFLGRLHRPQDFQFIVDGMTRVLNQPLQPNTSSYLPGTQNVTKFVPEMIMLFWEITQCNKRFRSFIIDTDRVYDFVVIILFYALEYKNDASKQGVVRMCAFLLQTLSVEKHFGINLNKAFATQDTLPQSIRIPGFRGSYADFLIQSIYHLITSSQGKLSAIYPALLAVINNMSAYMQRLSASTCSKLIQLFNSMSSPSFLLATEKNHSLLQSLLESINAIVEHQYKKNPQLVFTILRNKKRFEALRSFTLESGQEEIERRNKHKKDGAPVDPFDFSSTRSSVESLRSPTSAPRAPSLSNVPEDGTFAIGDDDDDDDDDEDEDEDDEDESDEEGIHPTPSQSTPSDNPSRASSVAGVEDAVPVQVRGMSEKARGKMPAGAPSFSRQNSITSLGSYPIASSSIPGAFEPNAEWIDGWLPELPLHTIITLIQQISVLVPPQKLASDHLSPELHNKLSSTEVVGIELSCPRVHSFEWSPMALGWYESLLWGLIFAAELQVAKGSMGLWNGTSIKLFRVQETTPQGPTLTSPRGAVDAVGSNIVNRIGSINLRGAATGGAGGGSGTNTPARG